MSKYRSPFSVNRRNTVFIGSKDPRYKNIEINRSRVGRDIIIKNTGNPLKIEKA